MPRFFDEARIWIKAGNGGDGCVAFRRERNIPRGGPSGGDGGDGGSVIFAADKNMRTLIDFHFRQHYEAENGQNGSGNNRFGKNGQDLSINVPCGTIITEISESGENLLKDMVEHGERFIIARGGKGGLGNNRFKSATNQAPRKATKGGEGESLHVRLELKLIAEVGIIGYPNSGKSTLISKVTRARPRIAPYPFTTLTPNLGVVDMGESRSFVIADIPGLIEGAAEGRGLGSKFLKHVERTKVLLHLVDLSLADPVANYHNIRKELIDYGHGLYDRPEIIVGNKTDMQIPEERIRLFRESFRDSFLISAITGEGVKPLMEQVWRKINEC
ncbi:MAG TPA: GTPase ObgE [bacterium]|nr:GTPase ObgE [bacterium]